MTNKFFFYGIYEGSEGDPAWKALHDHFEKLAREDKDEDFTERKAVKKREGLGG